LRAKSLSFNGIFQQSLLQKLMTDLTAFDYI